MSNFYFTDSHAHIDYKDYDEDRAPMMTRARESGVRKMLNIVLGPEEEKFERGVRLFENEQDVYLGIGIHPHDVNRMTDQSLTLLRKYCGHPKVRALGEVGLDYYYEHSPREIQIPRLREFFDLAIELKLPVSIHSRDAFQDTYDAVFAVDLFKKVGGVLHCFTGTKEEAKQFLNLGAYISFSGIITFKKAEALRETVKFVPIDRMLIETDAPFLSPEPYRGKRNEPTYVVRAAQTVAAVKGLSVEEVARVTSKNAEHLFNLV